MADRPEVVNFEVVVRSDGPSVFGEDAFVGLDNLSDFRPSPGTSIEAARKLRGNGITVHEIRAFSISAACPTEKF